MKPLKVIMIGAGGRGINYAANMKRFPEKYQVVGVADPLKERCEHIKNMFGLSDKDCYESWETILSKPKMADVAVIATMDDMHVQPALKAIDLGYDLLLEKPVAQTVEECVEIALAAEKKRARVLVCHVLRYAPFFKTVKQLVMDGVIGDILSIIQVEAVGHIHQSHSYVRGDWHREDESTPMIIAKTCHDLDIIQWLIDKPCKKVSSFGELTHFTPENAPEGAPERCIDGNCPEADICVYNCRKIYLGEDESTHWMRHSAGRGYSKGYMPTDEEVTEALQHNNFGACVYHANNDVVDHQVVNMEFEGGATAHLTMNAFNEGGRYIRIFGTKGELYAHASDTEIKVFLFEENKTKKVSVEETEESIVGGHGGGDSGIINDMYDYLMGSYTGYSAADIRTSVQNHIIGFAAEKARHNDTVENLVEYSKKYHFDYK